MKKIVVLAAFLTLTFSVFGQEQPIRFGFQLSPTFSWMSANTSRTNSSGTNLGLKMGMIGEFYFQENYAIVTGLGFAFNQGGTLQHERAGCYWDDSDLDLDSTFYNATYQCFELPSGVKLKYNIQYLEIPLRFKMRTREFGYLRYFLEPGITLGIETQATGSIEGVGIGNDAEKINIKREVNGLNMAWGLLGGVEYSISENTSLVGGLGFQVGFTDATRDGYKVAGRDTDELNQEDNSTGKVNNVTIRLAIMF